MPRSEDTQTKNVTKYLKDYQAPDFSIEKVDLVFRIFDGYTEVESTLSVKKQNKQATTLVLDGTKNLDLQSVALDGQELGDKGYKRDDESLEVYSVPDEFTLKTVVKIDPASNTALEGLYKSSKMHCTQCESEGFRNITYYPDRPDVQSKFTTRIEAPNDYPVLLSNGNKIDEGKLGNDRHYTVWEDPFNKPSYLFALVAGDLVVIEDHFITMSGRKVDLKIFTEAGDEDKCHFAMEALKKSMKWDEEAYGREYDLDIFNIVAVSDFNFGAMENKSLNIFNTSALFASPETATDSDFGRVEGIVAHEYFHNWSGNRVTCRDWFQLSLKEGLTVFRDQSFSGDMNSRAVQRISDVNFLRNAQFKEDAGPQAHPIRPESYQEINNFYTLTVYEKGSEVIRMFHTLLGEETYRKATDLYFDRHDGSAATCEDFVKAMEDASGLDLKQFRLWYSQAGTPHVSVTQEYDAVTKTYKLHFEQKIPDTPGQTNKQAMHIPIKLGLLDKDGNEFSIGDKGETELVLDLKQDKQTFEFRNIDEKPTPSILRGFSAPVRLKTDLTRKDHMFLMQKDTDGFNRWDSGQTIAKEILLGMINDFQNGQPMSVPQDYIEGIGWLLDNQQDDLNLLALSLQIPAPSTLAQEMDVIDHEAIYQARKFLRKEIANVYEDKLKTIYHDNNSSAPYVFNVEESGKRAIKNCALSYLSSLQDDATTDMLYAQFKNANNMTDQASALMLLADIEHDHREEAFEQFYDQFKSEALVINKWFMAQASSDRDDIMEHVERLTKHPDFTWKNPNRVRSVISGFASNGRNLHREDGAGYRFIKDAVIKLNGINPSVGARLATSLQDWKNYDPARQEKMKAALNEILETPNLDKGIREIVSKALEIDLEKPDSKSESKLAVK